MNIEAEFHGLILTIQALYNEKNRIEIDLDEATYNAEQADDYDQIMMLDQEAGFKSHIYNSFSHSYQKIAIFSIYSCFEKITKFYTESFTAKKLYIEHHQKKQKGKLSHTDSIHQKLSNLKKSNNKISEVQHDIKEIWNLTRILRNTLIHSHTLSSNSEAEIEKNKNWKKYIEKDNKKITIKDDFIIIITRSLLKIIMILDQVDHKESNLLSDDEIELLLSNIKAKT